MTTSDAEEDEDEHAYRACCSHWRNLNPPLCLITRMTLVTLRRNKAERAQITHGTWRRLRRNWAGRVKDGRQFRVALPELPCSESITY